MTLSSQSLPLWFGALELNNPLLAKNNGSGRWSFLFLIDTINRTVFFLCFNRTNIM